MIFLERTREGDCQSDQHWNCWKATLGKLLRQGRAHRYHFELNWSYCCIKYSLWTEPDLKLMFDIIISPAASAASHDSYKSCTSRAFEVILSMLIPTSEPSWTCHSLKQKEAQSQQARELFSVWKSSHTDTTMKTWVAYATLSWHASKCRVYKLHQSYSLWWSLYTLIYLWCTSGGVYILCIYLHARWELL